MPAKAPAFNSLQNHQIDFATLAGGKHYEIFWKSEFSRAEFPCSESTARVSGEECPVTGDGRMRCPLGDVNFHAAFPESVAQASIHWRTWRTSHAVTRGDSLTGAGKVPSLTLRHSVALLKGTMAGISCACLINPTSGSDWGKLGDDMRVTPCGDAAWNRVRGGEPGQIARENRKRNFTANSPFNCKYFDGLVDGLVARNRQKSNDFNGHWRRRRLQVRKRR